MNIIESIKKRFALAGPFSGETYVPSMRQAAEELSDAELGRHIALVRADAFLFPQERDRARAEYDRITQERIEAELDNGAGALTAFGEFKEAEDARLRILEPWTEKLKEYGTSNLGFLDAAIGKRLNVLYQEQRKRHQPELLKARAAAREKAIAQHEAFERLRTCQKRVAACGRLANVDDHREMAALQAAFNQTEKAYEAAVRAIVEHWGPDAA